MVVRLIPATDADLRWVERAVRTCPVAMAEFGGFYGSASTKLAPLIGADRELLIIWDAQGPVGFLDVDAAQDAESTLDLAYFVIPTRRQQGIAATAMRQLSRDRPGLDLRVAVGLDNRASLAAAIRAGFVATGINEWGEQVLVRRPDMLV